MRSLFLALSLMLSACATKQDFELLSATSLRDEGAVTFKGLEFLADTLPGQVVPRVNVVYMHGIGWTEDPDGDPLAVDFLEGITDAYGLPLEVGGQRTCLDAREGPTPPNDDLLYVTAAGMMRLDTAISEVELELDRLACVDRRVLDINGTLELAVYRVFWDDLFWNALQYQHVGQDDARGSSAELARTRRKYNRRLKDELVNYGFSDAVLYLGQAGGIIREAVRGAICTAHLDAGGYGFARQGLEVSVDDACTLVRNTSVRTNRFAFATESLGSKIAYDLFRDALTDGVDGPLDRMLPGSETYMFANQIPLLSLADVGGRTERAPVVADNIRPKLIALSEVNDFLTYEIVPFLEQLWRRGDPTDERPFSDPAVRGDIANRLGFDVVDLRVQFADPLVPALKGFVDPLAAHKDHAGEPEIMRLVLCGMEAGAVRTRGCLAAGE